MRFIFNYVFGFIFFVGILFIGVLSAYAGVSICPGIIEIVASKGQEVIHNIRVINTGVFSANVDIYIDKFSSNDISPYTWLFISTQKIELKPGEEKEIVCNFKIPNDLEGELRARLYISGREIGEGSSPIGIRFNVPVYAAIQDTVRLSVDIKNINIKYKNREVQGDLTLDNRSNVHIRPDIRFIANDIEGNLIGCINVPFGQPAQKEETRMFIFKEKMDLEPGKYRIIANVDYGKYYGLKGYVATKEVEFEVKPPEVIPPEVEENKGMKEKEGLETKQDVLEKIGGGE